MIINEIKFDIVFIQQMELEINWQHMNIVLKQKEHRNNEISYISPILIIFTYCLHSIMQSQGAQPLPEQVEYSHTFPMLENIFNSEKPSWVEEVEESEKCLSDDSKTKFISKNHEKYHPKGKQLDNQKVKRENHQKKIRQLERKIADLEKQLLALKNKYEFCPHCHFSLHLQSDRDLFSAHQEISNQAGSIQSRRNSRESVEFEKIDFTSNLLFNAQMDGKAWIYIGSIMMAMGSTVLEVDGTVNTFKILQESVDKVRRQIEKCESKVSLDFYLMKEEMKEAFDGLSFNPFFEKTQKTGFQLDGVKLESVEEFELIYDQKVNFGVKYESLITAFEYLKSHCSIDFMIDSK